jgi:hypothetical protein
MSRFNASLLRGDYTATSVRSNSQVDTGSEVVQREISKNVCDQFHRLHLFVAGNIVVVAYYLSLKKLFFV